MDTVATRTAPWTAPIHHRQQSLAFQRGNRPPYCPHTHPGPPGNVSLPSSAGSIPLRIPKQHQPHQSFCRRQSCLGDGEIDESVEVLKTARPYRSLAQSLRSFPLLPLLRLLLCLLQCLLPNLRIAHREAVNAFPTLTRRKDRPTSYTVPVSRHFHNSLRSLQHVESRQPRRQGCKRLNGRIEQHHDILSRTVAVFEALHHRLPLLPRP